MTPVKDSVTSKDRAFIFGMLKQGKPAATATSQDTAKDATPPAAQFVWADRIDMLKSIGDDRGKATTVKITLVGKLGKTIEKDGFVMAAMVAAKAPSMPKGLPKPPRVETPYLVLITAKQCKKIADAAKDVDDLIICEGWSQVDVQTNGIAVWCTNVTSKKIQAATREQKTV